MMNDLDYKQMKFLVKHWAEPNHTSANGYLDGLLQDCSNSSALANGVTAVLH